MDNAFRNLKFVHSGGSDAQLLLGYNNLTDSNIGPEAFRGLETVISCLDLSNNKLISFPTAIINLTHLKELYLESNQITTVNMQVLASIGHVLERLSISLGHVDTWPSAFHHLTALKYLKLTDYHGIFPTDAFDGFLGTLEQIVFHRSNLVNVPVPLCKLKRLIVLNITGNPNFVGRSIVHCNPSQYTVRSVMFSGDNNEYFPDLFYSFPRLSDIYINSSNISFIDDSLIAGSQYLTRLTISHSQLSTIPSAINKFTALVFLDLHSNVIRQVERYTLGFITSSVKLQHLIRIDLSDNPIVFISNDAFYNLNALLSLDLRGTRLIHIPQVIQGLAALTSLDLGNSRIFCDCNQPWLKSWAASTNVSVDGKCDSGDPIRNFLANDLPHCP